jgi:hypothetical protein
VAAARKKRAVERLKDMSMCHAGGSRSMDNNRMRGHITRYRVILGSAHVHPSHLDTDLV